MKSEYEIIDNALDPKIFDDVQAWFTSNNFAWYHQDDVAYDGNVDISELDPIDQNLREKPFTESQKQYNFALVHTVFEKMKIRCTKETWDKILIVFEAAGVKKIKRCKINYYPKTPEIVHHKDHVDFIHEHKGGIFYLNDNDGLTVLEDGTEIKSVANRLLLFDSSRPHHSTTCTNANRRLNINFNYF